ncbi:hypothetical protein [Microbacterium sp. MM2322]
MYCPALLRLRTRRHSGSTSTSRNKSSLIAAIPVR